MKLLLIADEANRCPQDNGNSDHEPAVQALLDGLIMRASASLPSFYIHLSGTAIISQWDRLGELDHKVWSDVGDIDAIWSRPAQAIHRGTEALIQKAWTAHGNKIKTAIVSPPNIHGRGTGPGRTDSFFVPAFYKESLKMRATFYLEPSSNMYSTVHVEDVAQVFLKLVEAAAAGGQGAEWGHDVRIENDIFAWVALFRPSLSFMLILVLTKSHLTTYSLGLLLHNERRNLPD